MLINTAFLGSDAHWQCSAVPNPLDRPHYAGWIRGGVVCHPGHSQGVCLQHQLRGQGSLLSGGM